MKVIPCEQIEAAPVETEGAVDCRMRCLIGPDDAAPSFSMRQFEVALADIPQSTRTPMSMKSLCSKVPAWCSKAIANMRFSRAMPFTCRRTNCTNSATRAPAP